MKFFLVSFIFLQFSQINLAQNGQMLYDNQVHNVNMPKMVKYVLWQLLGNQFDPGTAIDFHASHTTLDKILWHIARAENLHNIYAQVCFTTECKLHANAYLSAIFAENLKVLLHLLSEFWKPLLGRTRSRGKCLAAIRLSHRPELSGRAVHEKVDG